ncbi:CBS domain-containing protein [Amphibacillus marinus]|uniref:CBS domain-containing protein n=1 Tax=Amphibacillus marinus TaxID=872970 RepID=A0A1H8IJ93_9BACI|nr:CBS domain-containing protein [Amphibacillus marinus]SEN68309.1 CBS domain-containing protein [Amphibacillus marinus]
MRNDERFLVAFNKIEKHFDQKLDDTKYVPFQRAVYRLRNSDAAINRYSNDLLEFSELRNAIVHERTEVNYTIADPHDQVVATIEQIAKEVTAPQQVMPTFAKVLRTIQADLKVKQVFGIIRETEYSQFPVYRNKRFLGLLTDKKMLHWVAKNVSGDTTKVLETSISKLIDEEQGTHYQFIPRHTSVYQAEQLFIQSVKQHKRLEALLITETGSKDEKLLGMISPHDLIEIP